MINVNCNSCGAVNEVPLHYLDNLVKCPQCNVYYTAKPVEQSGDEAEPLTTIEVMKQIGAVFTMLILIAGVVGIIYYNFNRVEYYESDEEIRESRELTWSNRKIIVVERVDASHDLKPVVFRSQGKTRVGIASSSSATKWIVTYETPSGMVRKETLSYDPTSYSRRR